MADYIDRGDCNAVVVGLRRFDTDNYMPII